VGEAAETHTPTIEDTVSTAYAQDCGGFTVSLEPQTLSSPTLNVADFLTVDPATGALSLSTTDYSHLGTHAVKMKVTSTGYDQTGIHANGNAGNLPTLSYSFDVKIDMCPLDFYANTIPTDQTASVGQPSATGTGFYDFADFPESTCSAFYPGYTYSEYIECHDASLAPVDCALLGVTVNEASNSVSFAVTDPSYIGQYTVSVIKRAIEDLQAVYDAYFPGRSYEADRIVTTQFTMSVECLAAIVQTPTADLTYLVGSGAVDTGVYMFQESTNCNYGFTTTATGQPAFASHTPADT